MRDSKRAESSKTAFFSIREKLNELFNVNRSERGLVIGWMTRLSKNPLDINGNMKIPSMRRVMGKLPLHPKTQFGSVIPPEGNGKPLEYFPRKSELENLYLTI